MPRKQITKKCVFDKFYTNNNIAKELSLKIKSYVDDGYMFIEPSAGNCAFYDNFTNILGYDIEPTEYAIKRGVKKTDWLNVEMNFEYEKICVLGNPPFGERNNLSNKFIEKSISCDRVDVIAFILPEVYDKFNMQKVFPSNWDLLYEEKIPHNAFILNGEPYHVPCKFYIWKKNIITGKRAIKLKEFCDDFQFCNKIEHPDFFIFGASPGKIIMVDDVKPTNRGYYVKSKIDTNELIKKISSIDWKEYGKSCVNGGAFWMSKGEIVKGYENYYGK